MVIYADLLMLLNFLVDFLLLMGGEILGAEAINKSFPDFFERINHLGIETEVDHIYEVN